MDRYGFQDIPVEVKTHLKANINIICFELDDKGIKSGRHYDLFQLGLLNSMYGLKVEAGRKPKNFDDCSAKLEKIMIQRLRFN